MKNILILFLLYCLFLSSCSIKNDKRHKEEINNQFISETEKIIEEKDQIPTININKEYEYKEIELNKLADITYVPIETNNNVLINDNISALSHISDKYIIIVNYINYNCYIFDKNGKIINYFNHRGNGANEYLNILGMTVDENKKEIYIIDHPQKYRIMVYSFNGEFVRKLSLPANITLGTIHNFDEKNLLCEDNNYRVGNKNPYFLLSKQTGNIVECLDIQFNEERISPRFYQKTGSKGVIAVSYGYTPIIRCNDDFIIGDISQDTIYKYCTNKTLTPLLVRNPPIHTQESQTMVIPELKIPGMFFLEMTKREFNFETKQGFDRKKIVYDYKTGLFYEYVLKNKDYPDQSFYLNSAGYAYIKENNTICQFIPSHELVEANKGQKVYGNLKNIAETLKADDNPVLMIAKFRD